MKQDDVHLSCHYHDNGYAAGTVVIRTKIARFYLEQESSTPNNLMGRVKTVNYVCCEQDPLSHLKRLQMEIFCFSQNGTGAKSVAMATTYWVSFSFM